MLVLLDHGLYKELPHDFRLDYCRLWKALVLKDLPGVKHYCQKLNAGEMYSLLAAVLTSRSWDDITRLVGRSGGQSVGGAQEIHSPIHPFIHPSVSARLLGPCALTALHCIAARTSAPSKHPAPKKTKPSSAPTPTGTH